MRKWGNRRSLQLLQSIQEVGIIWNPFLDVLDDAIFVDKIGDPSPTITFLDRFICIGNERKADAVFSCKFLVGLQAVSADPDDLCVHFFKFFQNPLEVKKFIGSDRRKHGKIQCQYNIFLADEISRLNHALGRITVERRGFITHRHPH